MWSVLFAVFTIDVIVALVGFIVSSIKMTTQLSTKVDLCTHFSVYGY